MIDRKTLRILRKRDRGLYDRIIALLRITKGKDIPWSDEMKCWIVPPELAETYHSINLSDLPAARAAKYLGLSRSPYPGRLS